jgi:hypothetical protein
MARRLWTAQDQITAEVAAACGIGLRTIAAAIGCSHTSVRLHLVIGALEQQALKNRLRRAADPEKAREWDRTWRKNNLEKAREISRRYKAANRERVNERARIRDKADPAKSRDKYRRWVQANRSATRDRNRSRKALRRSARCRALLPITSAAIGAQFALWRNRCAYCDIGGKNTVDHVLPLIHGGLDQADNVAPSCKSCNSSKRDRPVETWYRRQPFFTEARWRKICRHCPAAVVGQLPLAFGPADEEAP